LGLHDKRQAQHNGKCWNQVRTGTNKGGSLHQRGASTKLESRESSQIRELFQQRELVV
jgi:hypothetical protein